MAEMRAKLVVRGVTEYHSEFTGEKTHESLLFGAVGKNSYTDSPLDEDNTFAKFTPCADLTICIQNPALFGQFNIGDTYYVDFTKID